MTLDCQALKAEDSNITRRPPVFGGNIQIESNVLLSPIGFGESE